ncbi:MAG TPA: alanine racemase [Patescibacteria group bacterium]
MLSFIEISRENLIHNFQLFRNLVHPKTKIAVLVKANAYGHGQNEIVEALENYADYFQIDDMQELRLIRKVTKKPVLVFGYVEKGELEEAVMLDGTLAVYDVERLNILEEIGKKLGKKISIHVKIDAELGRQGILPDALEEFVNALKNTKHIEVKGVYSHFANIEDASDFSHAQKQIDVHAKAVAIFKKNGFDKINTHISASSGILAYEQNKGISDIVRLGIAVYGMWPSEDLRKKYENENFILRPVMRWVSHVAQVKTLPSGHSIGYGLTFVTKKPTNIAVIPQGYSDGYDRGFSNNADVLIGGKRCPVLGRVAMNMFVADVSALENVQAEDEVVLLGEQENERITVEELAERISTINYEITTRVLTLLPRIVK